MCILLQAEETLLQAQRPQADVLVGLEKLFPIHQAPTTPASRISAAVARNHYHFVKGCVQVLRMWVWRCLRGLLHHLVRL